MSAMSFDALVLVGGQGTRLASVVKDVPKPMASVAGRPFVDVIVARLQAQGARRVIMATGHKADIVHDYYKDKQGIVCIREDVPLGTGGAVLNALQALPDLSDPFYVLNGDSFYPFDLAAFDGAAPADGLLGAVEMHSAARYGTLAVDDRDTITAFVEKTGEETPGLVSAGVYCLHKSIFKGRKLGPLSLEKDVFPQLAAAGCLRAVRNKGPMLDIGLPETYQAAAEFLKMLGE